MFDSLVTEAELKPGTSSNSILNSFHSRYSLGEGGGGGCLVNSLIDHRYCLRSNNSRGFKNSNFTAVNILGFISFLLIQIYCLSDELSLKEYICPRTKSKSISAVISSSVTSSLKPYTTHINMCVCVCVSLCVLRLFSLDQ